MSIEFLTIDLCNFIFGTGFCIAKIHTKYSGKQRSLLAIHLHGFYTKHNKWCSLDIDLFWINILSFLKDWEFEKRQKENKLIVYKNDQTC